MPSFNFPNPSLADPDGLLAVGGNLEPETLLSAYQQGIFPWFDEDTPILWWSPDPRAILEFDNLYISKRLARTIRTNKFQVTFNQDFDAVVQGCTYRPEEGTWITPEVANAYGEFHRRGHAHSVEVWQQGILVGGLYGVAIGALFAGESMFSTVSDASKIALVALVSRLKEKGYQLFDLQIINEHTSMMGATEIPRDDYLARVKLAIQLKITF
ncbi:MAG: leucyl/phenylalanyl-tRNA--protein transferase [Planctomycetota bacterium]|nr:MAG: leucyl/phenylalanyl-tRNA--protein transferase [Planctomycetota bacterium]